jgi:cell division protein FtsI/penicillin-binding protein 2
VSDSQTYCNRRFGVFLFSLLFWFALVWWRLWYWQIFKGEQLAARAISQNRGFQKVTAPRGEIYSSDYHPLVMNDKSFTLYAWLPELKIGCQQLFFKIKSIIGSSQEGLEKDWLCHLLDKGKGVKWVSVRSNLSWEQKQEIEKQQISGLSFEEAEGRFYPEASSAAHILGFLGKDQWGRPKGYFGLEGFYNNQLQGEIGFGSKAKTWFDYFSLINSRDRSQPKKGRDLVLYLDRTVQFLVEEELNKGIKKYGAVSGWVVVMDPKSGGIIASAAFPSYDPSHFYDYKPQLFANPVISKTFEPGSIFKPLIMAAAFQEGVVEPETQCQKCDGPVLIGDKKIRTWNDKYYPNSTMAEVIEHSDNVGMVWVVNKLGLSKTLSYLKKLGLGEKTGIDLEGEVSLPLKEEANWYPIDLATLSFGQGIALTPIQMLTAFSTLANGGELIQPRVVKEIRDGDKKQLFQPRVVRKVFDPKVTEEMTEILVKAASQGEIS